MAEEDLDMLLSMFEEERQEQEVEPQATQEAADDLDNLFDDDGGDEGGYVEPEEEEEEEEAAESQSSGGQGGDLNRSKEDLEAELRNMQEKMQRLQQKLEASQQEAGPSPPAQRGTGTTVSTPTQRGITLSPPAQQGTKSSPPTRRGSAPASSTKPSPSSSLRQPRTAHPPKAAASEKQSSLAQSVSDRSSQPMGGSSRVSSTLRSPPPNGLAPPIARPATPRPPASQDVAVEKFSGLRLRRPRLSSIDIAHKMADRKMIRLSQLPERLARDKLEESDWVTFGVVVNKITPQSKNNGKTFSIWKLNDLHNLEVYVSLFLFGNVHSDLWKTDTGTVIGILNPNPMKNKDGSNETCLTVDHPQKVLVLGEAMDFSTCQAKKKNGDACTQLVNLYECQYCQYHVKSQYKKMSSKRAELQSSFSSSAPGRGKGRGSLRDRLCQGDFHYGGLSSLACAASSSGTQSKKLTQPTMQSVLAAIPSKRLGLQSDKVSGCSDDFKGLMSVPTPGSLNIKRHLDQGQAKSTGPSGGGVQSISASQLLKQQKQEHQQRLQARKHRAEEIQKRVLQNSGKAAAPARPDRGGLLSPKTGAEVPGGHATPPPLTPPPHLAGPPVPTLGRGFTEGQDILFDVSPPPPALNLSAAKLAAVRKLHAKGAITKSDPNAVKRKRPKSDDISARVERNLTSPEGEQASAEREEPAQKKRREQQEFVQSEEFQRILNAKSQFSWMMGEVEEKAMQDYFDPLVQKEKLEDKMRSTREMKCRAVTCKACKYTHFKPADRCVEEKHEYHWHDATKRFFKCPCGQRKISLARLPNAACSNCGLFKWERDGMLKEKNGPKIGGELLRPRGEEQPKFLNSIK